MEAAGFFSPAFLVGQHRFHGQQHVQDGHAAFLFYGIRIGQFLRSGLLGLCLKARGKLPFIGIAVANAEQRSHAVKKAAAARGHDAAAALTDGFQDLFPPLPETARQARRLRFSARQGAQQGKGRAPRLARRRIVTDEHCFVCTAGAGTS